MLRLHGSRFGLRQALRRIGGATRMCLPGARMVAATGLAIVLAAVGERAAAGRLVLERGELVSLFDSAFPGGRLAVRCAAGWAQGVACAGSELVIEHAGADGQQTERNPTAMRVSVPRIALLGGWYQAVPDTPLALQAHLHAVSGGLQLEVRGGSDARFRLTCVAGACTDDWLVPRIVWRTPSIAIDLEAESDGRPEGALRLSLNRLSGHLSLACADGWGLAGIVCAAAGAALGGQLTAYVRVRLAAWMASIDVRELAMRMTAGPVFRLPGNSGAGGANFTIRDLHAADGGVRILFCLGDACD